MELTRENFKEGHYIINVEYVPEVIQYGMETITSAQVVYMKIVRDSIISVHHNNRFCKNYGDVGSHHHFGEGNHPDNEGMSWRYSHRIHILNIPEYYKIIKRID